MIVGSPQVIPWRFQYDLDVEYAVGRIHFETTGTKPEDRRPDYDAYRRYAQSLVAAENQSTGLPRSVAFFATNHDLATAYSSNSLVLPLVQEMTEWVAERDPTWGLSVCHGSDATRDHLAELVGGAKTPALLFTASHGVCFDQTDPRQVPHQGGLICQDVESVWGRCPLPENTYFAGDAVATEAHPHGLISFHFACFGAGTPCTNDFPDPDKVFRNQQIAPYPFASKLPQRLLSHPNGGAQAFVGHVDRAWSCSFLLGHNQEQIDTFAGVLKDLMDEAPIGHAVEFLNERYAALATVLTSQLDQLRFGRIADKAFQTNLIATWLEHNDARNYVIFGDPAVRLRTAPGPATGRAGQSANVETLGEATIQGAILTQ